MDAVGLHVQHQLERAGGEPVGVDGVVFGGVGVVVAAVFLHFVVELAGAVFLGAVEHHVFEEVRDAGDAGAFVAGADFEEEIHGDVGYVVILLDEDFHSVGEGVGFDVGGLGRGDGRGDEEGRKEPYHALTIADGLGGMWFDAGWRVGEGRW